MTLNLTIMLYASVPLCAGAGAMVGVDAHVNRWSTWPLWSFALIGALFGVPAVAYILHFG